MHASNESQFVPAPEDAAIEEWAQELNGRVLSDRYRIDRLLGYGATGGVFRGLHLRLSKPVAIKILHEELCFNPELRGRFDREAHAASRLSHPNCIEITDVGEDGDLNYLVMPFVEGIELGELMGQPMALERATSLIGQVLAALEHAHAAGIIHRDVKPENVLVVRDHRGCSQIKLLDFGIAKVTLPGDPKRLTRAGQVFGTPHYMSPEQARGVEVTLRSDIYSTGLILYELLTGSPVYDAEDPLEQIRLHLNAPPPRLVGVVPDVMVPVLAKMLAKDPEERFYSASAVRAALAQARLAPSAYRAPERNRATEPPRPSRVITQRVTSPPEPRRVARTVLATSTDSISVDSLPLDPRIGHVSRQRRPGRPAPLILLIAMIVVWIVLGLSTYLLVAGEFVGITRFPLRMEHEASVVDRVSTHWVSTQRSPAEIDHSSDSSL